MTELRSTSSSTPHTPPLVTTPVLTTDAAQQFGRPLFRGCVRGWYGETRTAAEVVARRGRAREENELGGSVNAGRLIRATWLYYHPRMGRHRRRFDRE